jgi:hypothetical protein
VLPSIAVTILHREVLVGGWQPVAETQTGGSIDIYDAPRGWRNQASLQQAFLRKEDAETRRIAYLYDDVKTSRNGQFNHQVFVPTPRPSGTDSISDDEDTEYDSTATSVHSRSSSPESGGHDDMAFSRRRPRRSSTMRRERAREEDDSASDQSGSASTCSSTSDLDLQDATDVAARLADQLRGFRAIKQSMLDSFDLSDDITSGSGKQQLPTSLRSGQVVKISLGPVAFALRPLAIKAGASLLEDFQHTVSQKHVQ